MSFGSILQLERLMELQEMLIWIFGMQGRHN